MQEISTFIPDSEEGARRTLSLEALRSFVAICELGSFRRAAARVHKSPSAVSLQIAKLEDGLGVTLFHRDARRVALTEHGETLLGRARRLLSLSDETVALFRKPALSGRLTLAAPHDLGVSLVPDLLRRVAESHPGLRVDVRLGPSAMMREALDAGTVNLALFNDVGPSDPTAREVFSEPLAWLMLKGGRAARQIPLPLAIAEIGCAWRDAALGALEAAHRDYRIAYASDTAMGQIAAVRADLAVAALPRSLVDRDLVEVPVEHGLPRLPLTHIRMMTDGSDLADTLLSFAVKGDVVKGREGIV